ncbi:MAG: deoxynucleoside kinase [Bacteroidales bacterium]|nr:deoxynucleoside kinase [Bacteroidales bacterium]
MHIAIAGNIGSGKTTLANLLARHYNWEAHFEDAETNPYLNNFYEDMERWAFNLQIYFMQSRLGEIIDIRKSGRNVIQDRTIYEDAYVFAENLHDMRLLDTRDFNNYLGMFEKMSSLISPPDLLIYLKANVSTLIQQIRKRGRVYEQSISPEYLTRLNEKYEKWTSSYHLGKILTVDIDNLNFPNNPDDLNKLIKLIDKTLQIKK